MFAHWILNNSIWPINGTLIGTTTQGQSGPGSNGNEGVLPIPQSSRTRTSHQMVYCHISLCRDAVSCLGWIYLSHRWYPNRYYLSGLFLWHINYCRLFNIKSCLYIFIRYMICKYFYQIRIILFTINYLFAHS